MREQARSGLVKVVSGTLATLAAALTLLWWTSDSRPGEPGHESRTAGAAGADAVPRGPANGAHVRDALADASAPAPGRGFFAAPAGSKFDYEFAARASSGVQIEVADQPVAQRMVLRLRGTMTVLVVARRDDELLVQVDLSGVSADQGVGGVEERSPALEELLALPALVRMRADGALLGFAFDPRSNGFVNNLVRSIVCGFRFVVPQDAKTGWEGEEADPTGIATVRYDWLDDQRGDERRLRRTKTCYRAAPGQRRDLEVGYEVRSIAVAMLSSALGWLRSAQVDETLTAKAGAASLRSSTEYEASLELATHTLLRLAELPDVSWDRLWAGVEGVEDTKAIGDSSDRELSELELGDATFASLLADIQALTAITPLDSAALTAASHKLAVLLRLHPDALEQLGRALPTVTPFAADVLLGAVGAAATGPAQRLLAGVAGDAGSAPHLRLSALDSMIQIGAPDDAVLASVRNLADDPDAGARLRNKSLLVLGALASRQPQSESTDRDAVVAELIGREDRARSAGQLQHWLHALGNSGHEDTLPAIQRYLGDDNAAVRNAAVSALRQFDTPQATSALLDRARSERDLRVRALAVEGLAQRSDSAGLDYVAGVLAREPDADVRSAAVAGLSRQLLRNEAVLPMLQRAAQHDPSPAIRDQAARAMARR